MNDSVIRAWARDAGIVVGRRGRLPVEVREQFYEAHPDVQRVEPEHAPRARCRCGRAWAGLAQAHCSTCHEHFSTATNFDLHRANAGFCIRPDSVVRKGAPALKQSEGPYGITWVGADERPTDLLNGEE